MKLIINSILTIVLLTIAGVTVYAQSAQNIVQSLITQYKSATSITSKFSMIENNYSFDGIITTEGNKFVIETPQAQIWYDGQTQWTYSADTNEVNVTEPTDEELQQVNPFTIITALSQNYTSELVKQTPNANTIKLKASIPDAYITQAIMELNKKDNMPNKISLSLDNGSQAVISITAITLGKHLPSTFFVFDAKKYPEAQIIDLR